MQQDETKFGFTDLQRNAGEEMWEKREQTSSHLWRDLYWRDSNITHFTYFLCLQILTYLGRHVYWIGQTTLSKNYCTNWVYFNWMVCSNMVLLMMMTTNKIKTHHKLMVMFNNLYP